MYWDNCGQHLGTLKGFCSNLFRLQILKLILFEQSHWNSLRRRSSYPTAELNKQREGAWNEFLKMNWKWFKVPFWSLSGGYGPFGQSCNALCVRWSVLTFVSWTGSFTIPLPQKHFLVSHFLIYFGNRMSYKFKTRSSLVIYAFHYLLRSSFRFSCHFSFFWSCYYLSQ